MGTVAELRQPDTSAFSIMDDESSCDRLHLIEELRAVVDRQQERRSGGEAWSVAFAPDNSLFAWSCGHRTVTLLPWHPQKARPVKPSPGPGHHGDRTRDSRPLPILINCGDIVWSMAFGYSKQDRRNGESPCRHYYNFSLPTGDAMVLAVGLNNGRIKIYTATGKLITELMDHRDVVRDLKFSPDGKLILLSASRDATLKLWDLKDDGNMFKTLKHSDNEWIMCCAWSPDAQWAASGGSGKEVYVWRTESWTLHRKLVAHFHNVASCQFSPDGAMLASCSYDTSVILWDHVNGQIMTIIWHMNPPPRPIFASGDNEHFVRHLSFSPDCEQLATVCDDGYVRVWSIYNSIVPVCVTEVQNALCAAYSSDGFCLAVSTREGTAHLFAPPMAVRSLVSICRSVIRRHVPLDAIGDLPVPNPIKAFLAYKDVVSTGRRKSLSYSAEN